MNKTQTHVKYQIIKNKSFKWYKTTCRTRILNIFTSMGAKDVIKLRFYWKLTERNLATIVPCEALNGNSSRSLLMLNSHWAYKKESKLVDCKAVNHQTDSDVQVTLHVFFYVKASNVIDETRIPQHQQNKASRPHLHICFAILRGVFMKSLPFTHVWTST